MYQKLGAIFFIVECVHFYVHTPVCVCLVDSSSVLVGNVYVKSILLCNSSKECIVSLLLGTVTYVSTLQVLPVCKKFCCLSAIVDL